MNQPSPTVTETAGLPSLEQRLASVNETLDAALAELELEGVLQVASYHPEYRFADSEPDDLANATNRSPYPTLHLLREDSIDRAVAAFPEAEAIFEANIETMEELGAEGLARLQQQCRDDAASGKGG